MNKKIKNLAKQAAEYWITLSDEEKEEYEINGTSSVFETVDMMTYLDILNSDDDEDTLFDKLDELMWNYVDELESKK